MDVLAVVKAVMDVTVGAGAAVVQGIPEVPDGAVGVAASDEAAYANIPLGVGVIKMTGDVETGPDGGITAREALN